MYLNSSLLTTVLTLPTSLLPIPSKRWGEIILLAKNRSYHEIISMLARQNMNEEIDRLEIKWIKECEQLLSQNRCMSFFCKNYPTYWKLYLGNQAPPSFWWNQIVPNSFHSSISIVGNRQIKPYVSDWTRECAAFLTKKGFSIVSGGAIGVDSSAAIGSLDSNNIPIEILPFGIDQANRHYPACHFSTFSPQNIFSTRNAMIRNQLIYAYSPHTIVVQSSHKKGGTWYGAVNALKKRLSHVHIWNHLENKGYTDLVKLGAIPFKNLDELISNLDIYKDEVKLFSI